MAFLKAPAWVWGAALGPRLFLALLACIDSQLALRGDSQAYLDLAASPFQPQTFRTPGYPLFLAPLAAVFPTGILPAVLLQCLLGGASAALAWAWLEPAAGKRGAAVAALVLALDPVLVLHTPLVMAEALFLLLVVAAAKTTWEALDDPAPRLATRAGLWWTAAALVKPIALYLPGLLTPVWRRERRAWLLFLACAWALPSAWSLRNKALTGHAVYSSIGGHDLLRYPAAGVESLRTGRPWAELEVELRAEADAEAGPGGWLTDADKAAAYGRKGAAILKEHPFLLVQYCAWGAVKVLSGTGLEMVVEWLPSRRPDPAAGEFRPRASGQGTRALLKAHPWLIPLQLAYWAVLAALYGAALLGLRALWTAGCRRHAAFLAGCALYFLALASSQGYYRYRIPLLPFLGAAAAFAAGGGAPGKKLESSSTR